MKTLVNPKDKAAVLSRLQAVRPTTPRRWGRMSPHQMICHLADGFRMYMSLTRVDPLAIPYPRWLVKCIAIWIPLPWPRGFRTVPEIDQEARGTPPAEFEKDVQDLRTLIERFTRRPRDFEWQPHPIFGALSETEWMRLGYLHVNHHLRQFGT